MGIKALYLTFWLRVRGYSWTFGYNHSKIVGLNLRLEFYASVAQLDRVGGFEPLGRGFESLRMRHYQKPALWRVFII